MNKIYVLVPLICVLIFGGFYWNFEKGYEARIEAKRHDDEVKLKAKQAADTAAREKAFKDAIDAAARRKKEREDKDRIEEEKKKARLDAEDHRQHVFDDRNRLRDQVKRLHSEVDAVKAEIAKLEDEKTNYNKELAFLREYVKKAEANQKYYYDLLDRIAAADDAAAKAKAAAEAAAKAAKG
jgi:colicin import membrane protein